MIITIMACLLLIIGLLFAYISSEVTSDFAFGIAAITGTIGSIAVVVSVILICSSHIGIEQKIASRKIEYEGIIKQVEIATETNDTVAKVEALHNATEWNQYVYQEKYWAENPNTSWFHSQKYVNSLEYIDVSEVE